MLGVFYVPYVWHATSFEILWLVAGIFSTMINSINLRDSFVDRELLQQIQDDKTIHEREKLMIAVAAKARENSQVMRIAISLCIVFSGLVGVVTPNPLGGYTTWTGLALTISLMMIAILTAVKGWLDFYIRENMIDLAQGRSTVQAAKMRVDQLRMREHEDLPPD